MNIPIEYLESLKRRGIHLGLGPISRLLERMGNPQNQYKTILIGGTNGKGSTSAILASILVKEGMNVGLYTSPHLCDFRERIRINGHMIDKDSLDDLIDRVRVSATEDVTYFEYSTAMAFLYFYLCKVDIAVVEVGMGGRLDATNLVSPELSIITNVSLEHQQYLGPDLKTIAQEKGGIIKEGGVCVTADKKKNVISTLEDICLKKGAVFYRIGRDMRIRRSSLGSFTYYGINKCYKNLKLSLPGSHQVGNAALALAAIDILAQKGVVDIGDASVKEGLGDVRWDGRLETIYSKPRIVVDGAHNPAGIATLGKFLANEIDYKRLILIFGVLRDKNCAGMLKIIAPLADHLILTRPKEERASMPEEIFPFISKRGNCVEIIEDSQEAIERACSMAGEGDLVCVTGSLYLVGEIKKQIAHGADPIF